jgi:rod shape-determining protein MreC
VFKLKKKNLIYFLIVACGILILSSLISPLRPLTLGILKTPLKLFTLITREIKAIIFYHRNYIQNERLIKEVDLLKRKLNTFNEISLENKRLNNLLNLKQKVSYKVIAGRVIGRSPDNWSSMIIIDKGRIHGIKRGFVAIDYLGLVGRVVEVLPSESKIMLINDPNLGVSVINQRTRQEALVSGTLSGSLIMRYLPKDADIKISDVIITSGSTGIFPKGLLIGWVVDIGSEFSGLSRFAVIKPASNLSSIEEVLIIIP